MITLDEPKRTALDAQRVQRVEYGHARRVEGRETRGQAPLTDVAHDGVGIASGGEEIEESGLGDRPHRRRTDEDGL